MQAGPYMLLLVSTRRSDSKRAGFVKLDTEDYDWAKRYSWSFDPNGYAFRTQKNKVRSLLSRELLGLERGDPREAEHINRQPLDNRRSNLRITTHAENLQNRRKSGEGASGERGVCWTTREGKWRATAVLNGKQHHLGYFVDKARAIDAATTFRREHMPFSAEDHLTLRK